MLHKSVTFERGSFPHFVHFSLNTADKTCMLNVNGLYRLQKSVCGKRHEVQLRIFLYANNPLDGTADRWFNRKIRHLTSFLFSTNTLILHPLYMFEFIYMIKLRVTNVVM